MRTLVLYALLLSPVAAADIYKCQGDDGVIMFSGTPCSSYGLQDASETPIPRARDGQEDRVRPGSASAEGETTAVKPPELPGR
jgi:hypothetical protein